MKKTTLLLMLILCGYVTVAQVCFNYNSTSPATGSGPMGATTGDFNNDGKKDMAVAVYGTSMVSVMLGQGNGNFLPTANYAVGSNARAVTVADFNADGNSDLAVSVYGGFSVLLGSATGTFASAINYPASGDVYDLCAADFNADGKPDMAVTVNPGNYIYVFLNNGTGGFVGSVQYQAGSSVYGITYGDFNEDSKTDIAVSNSGSNNISILIGSGSGTFAAPVNYTVAGNAYYIVNSDFNADGHRDLAVINHNTNNVSVVLGTGTGAFGAAANYAIGTSPVSIALGDFNNDSKTDIATSNAGSSNNISVLLGTGTGAFSAATSYTAAQNPSGITSADFNNDTYSDIGIVSNYNNNVSILLKATVVVSASTLTNCPSYNNTLTASGANTYSYSNGATTYSTIVYPFTTATYTAYGTNLAGCTSTAAITITVYPSPNPGGTSNSPACTGYPINFANTSTGAATYSWTGPAGFSSTLTNPTIPSATTSNAGTYTIQAISSMGCTATTTLIVNVNTSPTVVIAVTNGTFCVGGSATLSASGANVYNWNTGATMQAIIVSPTVTTSYTVTGVNAAGCSSVAIATVVVNPTPTITVNSGSVCAGQSFTMTPGGASSYTYSSGSNIVTPSANTNYSVTGTSAAGCVGTNTAVSSVTVNANPTITVNSGTLCSGNSFTLNAAGANTYTYTGGSNIVTPLTSSNYSVTGTSLQGCAGTNTAVSSLTVYATPVITVNSGSICSGTAFTVTPANASTYTITGGNFIVSPITSTNYSVTGTSAQGCVASNTAVSSVTVNATPTISVNNGTICAGQSFTVNAGGATTYTWNTGPTTSSIVVNPPATTSYTVTGASPANCTSTAVQTLVVNALPVLTLSPTSTLLCSGATATITASGAATYTWEPGTVTGSPFNATPLASTNYTVTGTSAAGCTNTAAVSVSVNPTPTLTVASTSLTVCSGAVATLTPGGADTYTLNPGNINGTTFTVNPTGTTQYSISGLTNAGCFDNGAATITITVNALTAISGAVTTAPALPVAGDINLYESKPFLTKLDVVATQTISGSGNYTFNGIAPGVYIIQAVPTDNTLQVTYGNSSISWHTATTFTHDCIAGAAQNIDVVPVTDLGGGPGSLSGTIREGNGYVQKANGVLTPGNPIGGVIIKGGRNPGGNVAAQGRTNASGEYTLTNLRSNQPNESYFIIVDIPGLDTTNTYHRIIYTGSENYTNLDFTVDSAHIVPNDVTVGIKEVTVENGSLIVYPNPASNNITVYCELKKAVPVKIELMDITGRTVQTLLPQAIQAEGELKVIAAIADIKQGIYFVKMSVGNEERTTKIVITR